MRFLLPCWKKPTRLILSFCILSFCAAAAASVLPPADREESERFFAMAYNSFLERDYASALTSLDSALKLNTYLVDYYLMRGLVLHRLGRSAEAVKSIRYYLEVRPRDSAAPRILERYRDEDLFIRNFLSGAPLQSRISSSLKDIKSSFSLGLFQTLGIKGLGKASAYADGVFISDTLGDKVGFRLPGETIFQFVEVEAPVVALPTGDKGFYILSEKGDVFHLPEGERIPTRIGGLSEIPSDAALITRALMAVSSAVSRKVSLFSLPDLLFAGEIKFPEAENLFEPVALAVYGGWIAAADRNNDRVYVQSLQDENLNFSLDADAPRDLAWSSLGDLFILHEPGSVSRARISFSGGVFLEPETVLAEAPNGWSLYAAHDRIYCLDIAGSRLWEMFPAPLDDALAMLSLFSPSITREAGRESFLLQATLSGPFMTYMSLNSPVVASIWNERLLGGAYLPSLPEDRPATVSFKPPEEHSAKNRESVISAASGGEVVASLVNAWHMRKGALANVVIAASTPFSFEELVQLTSFCLQNKVRMFVHADAIPSLELLRGAALTSGDRVFTPNAVWSSLPSYSRGKIRIVLPADETSSGFPSRSTLSVYLDIGVVPTRDWVPLWPDLL